MSKNESPIVCARVPEKVRRVLRALADEKGVNLSEYLRWLLIDYAAAHKKKLK